MLTTGRATRDIVATMAKRQKPGSAVLAEIYAKRQARRPHYLGKIMQAKDVSRAQLVDELGVDKSQLSRWLDRHRPSTPSPEWAEKLGYYFASDPDDFVDIFVDPDVARLAKIMKGRTPEEVDRMLATLEAAFPMRRAG